MPEADTGEEGRAGPEVVHSQVVVEGEAWTDQLESEGNCTIMSETN